MFPQAGPLRHFGFLEGEAVLKTLQLYVAACAACGFGYVAGQNAHLKYSFFSTERSLSGAQQASASCLREHLGAITWV